MGYPPGVAPVSKTKQEHVIRPQPGHCSPFHGQCAKHHSHKGRTMIIEPCSTRAKLLLLLSTIAVTIPITVTVATTVAITVATTLTISGGCQPSTSDDGTPQPRCGGWQPGVSKRLLCETPRLFEFTYLFLPGSCCSSDFLNSFLFPSHLLAVALAATLPFCATL